MKIFLANKIMYRMKFFLRIKICHLSNENIFSEWKYILANENIFYRMKIYFYRMKIYFIEWKYILSNENISISNCATFRQPYPLAPVVYNFDAYQFEHKNPDRFGGLTRTGIFLSGEKRRESFHIAGLIIEVILF